MCLEIRHNEYPEQEHIWYCKDCKEYLTLKLKEQTINTLDMNVSNPPTNEQLQTQEHALATAQHYLDSIIQYITWEDSWEPKQGITEDAEKNTAIKKD